MIKKILKYRKIILGIMLSLGLFFCSENVFAKQCKYDLSIKLNSTEQLVFDVVTENGKQYLELANDKIRYKIDGGIRMVTIMNMVLDDDVKNEVNSNFPGYLEFNTNSSRYNSGNYTELYDFDNKNVVRIPTDDGGKCPKIYIDYNSDFDAYFVMPYAVDCNGSWSGGIWDTVNDGATRNYECDLLDNNLNYCDDDKILGELSKKKEQLINELINEPYNQLVKYANDASYYYEHSNNVTKENCESLENNLKNHFSNKKKSIDQNFKTFDVRARQKIGESLKQNDCDMQTDLPDSWFTTYSYNGSNMKLDSYVNEKYNDIDKLQAERVNACAAKANLSQADIDKMANDLHESNAETIQDIVETASETVEKIEHYTSQYRGLIPGLSDVPVTCEGLIGNDLLELIKTIYNYIKIAAPILLIIFGTIDFGGAVISGDKDLLAKAFNKFIKRAIICAAIFFVPYILEWLLSNASLPNGDPIFDDPMCGIK